MAKVKLPDTASFQFAKNDTHERNELFPDWTLCGLAHCADVMIVASKPSCFQCRFMAKALQQPP